MMTATSAIAMISEMFCTPIAGDQPPRRGQRRLRAAAAPVAGAGVVSFEVIGVFLSGERSCGVRLVHGEGEDAFFGGFGAASSPLMRPPAIT